MWKHLSYESSKVCINRRGWLRPTTRSNGCYTPRSLSLESLLGIDQKRVCGSGGNFFGTNVTGYHKTPFHFLLSSALERGHFDRTLRYYRLMVY